MRNQIFPLTQRVKTSKEWKLNKLYTSYALFLATLERRAPKGFFGPKLFFDKNFQFLSKNNFGPIDFLLARLFLRSKKTVRKKCIAYLIHVP